MMDKMYETQASKYGYTGGTLATESYAESYGQQECETNQILMRLDEIEKRLSDVIVNYSRVADRLLGPIPEKADSSPLNSTKLPAVVTGVIGEIKIRENEIIRKISILEQIAQRLSTI